MSGKKMCRAINKNFTTIVQLHQFIVSEFEENKELFMKLLDRDFDINYKIPIGNTSFQTEWMEGCTIFQLIFTNAGLSKVLIDHGADFTVSDKKGSTSLHKNVTNSGYKRYLDSIGTSIADRDDDDDDDDNDASFVHLILSAHINSGNIKNPKDKNNLSHFHIACMYNRADAAKFFLENGVPINEIINRDSEFYPGFSALHFAVKSCALETVELLLQSDADIFAQDSKGMNPLHLLIIERRKMLIMWQRLTKISSPKRETLYCSELEEYCNRNLKIIHLLLKRMKELDDRTVDNTGLSYLHVLCFLGITSTIQEFLDDNDESLNQSVSMDSTIWPGYTPLHFAAHSNVETVELILKKGADIGVKNAEGITPFELCLNEFSIADVHRILLLQPNYFNITFNDNKTKLGDFIYAMRDNASFENFLKNNLFKVHPNSFIPLYSPICSGFTALHLVVFCTAEPMIWSSKNHDSSYDLLADMEFEKSQNYLSRIKSCLRYNPDVTSRDARGSTPLHWAFKLQQNEAVHLLLKRHESNCNPIDEHGLSHLHIACAAKNVTVIEKLLSGGANVNEVATLSYTWMNVNTRGRFETQVQQKYIINEGSTPLHFASTVRRYQVVKILIDHNADVLAKDSNGFNPLERLFKVPIFQDSECPKPISMSSFDRLANETIRLLIKSIGAKLADTKPKQMLYCYNSIDDRLIEMIPDDAAITKILESVGITALHVACLARDLERVNELVNEIDVNARVDLESPLWPGCTPLHLFTRHRAWQNPLNDTPSNRAILEKLLQSGADVSAMDDKGDTPIHQSLRFHRFFLPEMLKYLKNFSVNPMGKAGFTHLHIASAYGTSSIVEKLLENGADVDYTADYFIEKFAGFTALHFAASFQKKDIVDVLLEYGADANKKNAQGGNPLHVINKEGRPGPCLELLRTLISAGADINHKDMHGETPLVTLLKSRNCTKEEIELFLTPHMRFHTFNLISDEGFLAVALNRSIRREQMPIYEIAINASDVKDIDDNGRNAIHNIVSFKRPGWNVLDYIRIDEDAISEKYTPHEDYIREIRSLMKLGLNIDQQDNKGFTPLHMAARMQNLTGIIGLLENGADINITDSNGKTAFAYSFEIAKIHEEVRFETEEKELKELDARILKVILTHIYKLNLAGIAINQSTREVVGQIREIQSYDASRIEKCMNEIEEMKEQRIDSTTLTLYEFLSDTGAVSNFPYFLSRQQTAIERTFENEVESLRGKFPELTGILLWQYRKAVARCSVTDSAVSSLKFLVNFSIPPNISKVILRFLNNDELAHLISSATLDK